MQFAIRSTNTMRAIYFGILALFIGTASLKAGPAPYGSTKIYILDPTEHPADLPTADFIRKNAEIVISLGVYTVDFFPSLHWEKAKYDPSIKQKATPLVMIIDLYNRVQPEPPNAPSFETLYCSRNYAYSEDGRYIDLSAFTAKTLKFPLR